MRLGRACVSQRLTQAQPCRPRCARPASRGWMRGSLLLAGLIEAGSGLGFVIIALASKISVPQTSPGAVRALAIPMAMCPRERRNDPRGMTDSVRIERHPHARTRTRMREGNIRAEVDRFLQARTISADGAVTGSTALYESYKTFCRTYGQPEPSQQALGRELTRLGMPKIRCKRTGRVEYVGMALNDPQKPAVGSGPPHSSGNCSAPKVQPTAAQVKNRISAADPKVLERHLALPSNAPCAA